MPAGRRRRTGSGWDEKNSQPEDRRALTGFWGSGCRLTAQARSKIASGVLRSPDLPRRRCLVKQGTARRTLPRRGSLTPGGRTRSGFRPRFAKHPPSLVLELHLREGGRGLGSEVHIKPPRAGRESGHGPLSVAGPTVPAVDPRPLVAMWNRFRRAGCG